MALSAKHQQFVNEYLKCLNATQAYQRVYDCGYETANVNGYRLLVNTSVSEEVKKRLAEYTMSANEVLARLAEHARGDMDDFLDDDGNLDLKKVRAARKTRLIKKYKTRTTTRIIGEDETVTVETEFDLYDAQAALVHLGKHHKLFTDKVELSGDVDIAFVNVDVDKL